MDINSVLAVPVIGMGLPVLINCLIGAHLSKVGKQVAAAVIAVVVAVAYTVITYGTDPSVLAAHIVVIFSVSEVAYTKIWSRVGLGTVTAPVQQIIAKPLATAIASVAHVSTPALPAPTPPAPVTVKTDTTTANAATVEAAHSLTEPPVDVAALKAQLATQQSKLAAVELEIDHLKSTPFPTIAGTPTPMAQATAEAAADEAAVEQTQAEIDSATTDKAPGDDGGN